MTQEHWQRLKEIVGEALEENSPAARTALLNRACAEDLSLLREAESYLKDAETTIGNGHDPLEECAAATAAALRQEGLSMTGRRIGAYVVVRELGHGGMATVYLGARADGYFEKQVAIKVLKPGGGDTAELLGRFRGEREVLASLQHPNIATLFDAGTTEKGMPYFVMEYVPGVPVTAYVREHHLPIRERLALFLKICAAVEVAHRRRIVHRDLKRSNILVTEEGEPKLLDFGIAKLLEENPLAVTATGQQRLTPISASPEQARGEEVTRSSDIYALGALLYEILTGRTPHVFPTGRPNLAEVARVVGEEDPVLPSLAAADSETQRALRGDLDAIILRAMQKDPAQRYNSVDDLAEDLRCYLEGKPVSARPRKLSSRLAYSFSRRRSTALVAVALLASVALALFLLYREAGDGAREAKDPAQSAIPEKSIAVLPFDDFAGNEANSYFADGVQDDILTDLAQAADLKVISRTGVAPFRKAPRNIREIGRKLGVAYVLEGSVRKLGDRVRVNAQLIDTRSDAQVWAEQYDRKVDDLFALQSDVAQAIVGQLKGKLSAREKAAIESRPTSDVEAYDLYLQARESFQNYRYKEAIDLLERAVARDSSFAVAHCLLTYAHLYAYRFGDDRSAMHLKKAEEAAETALRLAPQLPEAHLAKAQYYYNGVRDYEKALSELATASPSPAARAKFFDLAALAERRLGRWKDALRDGEKALELDPHDPFIAVEVIQTYSYLRRYEEAEKLAHRSSKLITAQDAPFVSMEVESVLAQGDPARARALLEAASGNADARHIASAQTAIYMRDFAKAIDEIEAARKWSKLAGSAIPDLMAGIVARLQGDATRAKACFEKAREILEASTKKHPDDAYALSELAWAYAGLGRKDDALRVSQQYVQLIPSWRDATEGPTYATMQTQIQAWVGDKEAAMKQLTGLVRQTGGPSYGGLKFDPVWDSLRDDPRFAELVVQAAKPIQLD
jgi:serine/threonine protein kinase/predicted Zn-dependent protease